MNRSALEEGIRLSQQHVDERKQDERIEMEMDDTDAAAASSSSGAAAASSSSSSSSFMHPARSILGQRDRGSSSHSFTLSIPTSRYAHTSATARSNYALNHIQYANTDVFSREGEDLLSVCDLLRR